MVETLMPSTPKPTNNNNVRKSFALERSEDHIQGLIDWVNAVTEQDCEILNDVADKGVLCKLHDALIPTAEKPSTTLEDIMNSLEYSLGLANDSWKLVGMEDKESRIADMIQLALACAVQGERKETYVSLIMSLELNTQHCLMLEVDVALKKCAHLQSTPTAAPSPLLTEMIKSSQKSNALVSPSNLKAMVKRLSRENEAVRTENEQLLVDNTILQEELDLTKETLMKIKQDKKEGLLKQEVQLDSTMQDKVNSLLDKVEEKDREIAQLKGSLELSQRQIKQADSLRDQVEILTSQVQEMSKKDASIARLKERLNGQSDLISQVQDLEAVNADLVEKNSEMDKISRLNKKLQSELEACKEAYTESQLSLSELRATVDQKVAMVETLSMENESLVDSNAMRTNLAEQLNVHLQQQDDLEAEISHAGLGVSELNPHIRESLSRLEKENEDLKASLSECSASNLSRLNIENDSLTRMQEKLQCSLQDANKRCEELNADVLESKKTIKKLEKKLKNANEKFDSAIRSHELERQEISLETEQKICDVTTKCESKLNSVQEKCSASIKAITEELECSRLEAAQKISSAQSHALAECIIGDLVNNVVLECEIGQLSQILESLKASHEEKTTRLCLNHTQELAKLEEELESCRRDAESYKASHVASVDDLENLQNELTIATETISLLDEEKQQMVSENVKKVNEMTSRLLDTQEELEKAKSREEHHSMRADDLGFQNSQLRRQLKTLQVQRNQSAQRGEDASEQTHQDLIDEIQRLQAEIIELSERSKSAVALKAVSSSGKGASEMARSFSEQIEEQEKKLQILSLGRTSDLMARKKIEGKLQKVLKDFEELKAENTSLRLRLERERIAKENYTPSNISQPASGVKHPQRKPPRTPQEEPLRQVTPTSRKSSVRLSQSRPRKDVSFGSAKKILNLSPDKGRGEEPLERRESCNQQ